MRQLREATRLEDEEDDQTSGVTELPDTTKHRVIWINKTEQTSKFTNNKISTAKYNLMTFLPKFLFEQFRRAANVFFLFIAALQQIPNVSPTGRFTTAVPLVFILLVSAAKEIVEDVKRHLQDGSINNRMVLVLRQGIWKSIKWTKVKVGDIVKCTDKQFFPADLVLISSSEPQGICYIETSNLDGETNLKLRQGVSETTNLLTIEDILKLNGTIECEVPNRNLYDFVGNIRYSSNQAVPLGPDQILLRGAQLRNTNWIFGIVIYTGHETKLMMNSKSAPLKRSTVDKFINVQILMLFFFLIGLCLISAIASMLWANNNTSAAWYLGLDELSVSSFGYNFLTFIILYNNLIPISLQVSLELVRFIQAIFINMDLEMYHEATDTPALARTSNLNEELGQIKYVFSDKTGTLTRNEMEFKDCSIAGIKYGENGDERLLNCVEKIKSGHPTAKYITEFLTMMAVCHTVVPEKKSRDEAMANGGNGTNGDINYQSASPDEGALVKGAKQMGFIFTTRTPSEVYINALGREERYEILNVLDFTSARKRMSVIVRTPSGKIKLYTKGADSVIYERLRENQEYREQTLQHLKEYASDGLRTLCFAAADIPQELYDDWKQTYYKASTAIQFRERKLEDAAQLIENNLVLLGATAIEDKLQEGVPESIASLLKADIKVWVLTGDKQETAINIGYSCKLITLDMPLLVINEDSLDSTRELIRRYLHELNIPLSKENDMALIVDGKTLKYAFSCDLVQDFLDIAISCKSVICCRVSPMQKAEVVDLIKKKTKAVTLAIGDGANDVAMIQAAHVGIGISGVEGLQASLAADYSIAQFRFLCRLLFVHGVWNYCRLCKLILYSFHKNICLYLIGLWYGVMNGWSGQPLFDRWTIGLYNVLFTAFPPLALGLFDRCCSADALLKYPALYKPSQERQMFNVKIFWIWIIDAIIYSLILFWMTMQFINQDVAWSGGGEGGRLMFGNMVYTYVVITVCLKAGLEMDAWTYITHMTIWGSIAIWFVFFVVYAEMYKFIPISAEMAGMDQIVYSSLVFWFALFIVPVTTLLGDVVFIVLKRSIYKSYQEAVRESEITHTDPADVRGVQASARPRLTETARLLKNVTSVFKRPGSSATSSRIGHEVELQHGYAFSQEEHGVMSQMELVRAYDTTKTKPTGV